MRSKRITAGDLARAIARYRSIVTDDMARVWCERGIVPATRNPGIENGWWYVLPEALPKALHEKLLLNPQEIDGVLKVLGLRDGKQTSLFPPTENT